MEKALNNIKTYFQKLINSYEFPAIIIFISAIFFILGIQTVQFIIVVAVSSFVLLSQKNTLPLVPLIISFILSIREVNAILNLALAIPLFGIGLIAIILHIVFYVKKFTLGILAVPLLIVTVCTFLGGIGSEFREYFSDGLTYALSAGLIPLLVYLFFTNTVSLNKEEDTTLYLSYMFLSLCITVSLEILSLKTKSYFSIVNDGYVSDMELGWLNTGFAGYFYTFGITTCFFFMVKKHIVIPFLVLATAFLVVMFLSEMDSAFAINAFMFAVLSFFTYFKIRKSKKKLFNLSLFILVVLLLLLVIYLLCSSWFLEYFKKHFLNDTGRSNIYRDGWFLFTENKWLGSGLGAPFHVNNYNLQRSGYMHSTLLEVLCTMGFVGLIAYIVYYYFRLKIFVGSNTNFNFYVFCSFLTYQCDALCGNAEFSFLTVFITILTVIVEKINKGEFQTELPLQKQL